VCRLHRLTHDQLPVGEAQHGQRAQHGRKRLGAQLGQEGQRVILLLIAHEHREIERGLARLFHDVRQRTGVANIPDFQHGRWIDRCRAYRKTRKQWRTRGVGLDQQGEDVVHRLAQLAESIGRDDGRQRWPARTLWMATLR